MSEQVRQIAMRITDLREISDYTVEQMAALCEVSPEEYARYESGETDIPISFLLKLNEHFGVDMTELLTGEAPRLNLYSVTRAGKGQLINRRDQYIYKNLAYNFIHRKIEPLFVTIPTEATEMFHILKNAENPHFYGFRLHTFRTTDKVIRYGINNQFDFAEHPAVIQRGEKRTINICVAVPDVA